jgi:hypothetical protein
LRIDDDGPPRSVPATGQLLLGKVAWDAEGAKWALVRTLDGPTRWERVMAPERVVPASQPPPDAEGDEVVYPPPGRRVSVRG